MTRQPDRSSRRRWWLWSLGVLGVLTAVAVVVTWWPHQKPSVPIRARQYTDFTSCLLTDSDGVAAPPAASVWAGMQDASVATRSKVQYLAVVGPQTASNAKTFLASLAQGKCDLVLAAGSLAGPVVQTNAPSYPNVHFVVVGSGTSVANLQIVPDSSATSLESRISTLVRTAASSEPGN